MLMHDNSHGLFSLCGKWYRFTFVRKHIIQFKIIFFIWGDWNCYVAHIRRQEDVALLGALATTAAVAATNAISICFAALFHFILFLSVGVVLGICTLCACKHYSLLCLRVLLFAHWLWVWCFRSSTLSPFAHGERMNECGSGEHRAQTMMFWRQAFATSTNLNSNVIPPFFPAFWWLNFLILIHQLMWRFALCHSTFCLLYIAIIFLWDYSARLLLLLFCCRSLLRAWFTFAFILVIAVSHFNKNYCITISP